MKKHLSFAALIIAAALTAGCGESADNTAADITAAESSSAAGTVHSAADPIKIPENARVSYLGPAGTYTEGAAQLFFGETAAMMPQATVDDAVSEMISGNADYAVIPQENTLGGAVADYVDTLLEQENVYVVGEVILPISQTLMGIPGTTLQDIKTVCSHAQGIKQSEQWRKANLPDAVTMETDSTAAAAGYAAEMQDKSIAAVAAPGAAKLYGLEVIAENVQINMENKTRFYVLSREKNGNGHTNAVFAASCEGSMIDDIFAAIHDSGLDTVSVHDRPEGSALGVYNYIIETKDPAGITKEQIDTVLNVSGTRYLGCFDVTAA